MSPSNRSLVHHWAPRLASLIAGVMVCFAGTHFIVQAGSTPGLELAPQSPTGITNIRVIGAFHLGAGLIAIAGALRSQWTRAGLAVTFVVGLVVVLVRLYGLSFDGATDMNKTIGMREAAYWSMSLIGLLLIR